jgi:hypothetical protein
LVVIPSRIEIEMNLVQFVLPIRFHQDSIAPSHIGSQVSGLGRERSRAHDDDDGNYAFSNNRLKQFRNTEDEEEEETGGKFSVIVLLSSFTFSAFYVKNHSN